MFTLEEIETVKKPIGANNLLVNDKFSVPEAEGNRHYRIIQEWLAGGPGRFIEEPTQEEIDARAAAEAAQSEKELVKKAISAGNDLIVEAMVILKNQDVSTEQATTNAQVFAPVQQLLQAGSIQTARDIFSGIDLSSTSLSELDRTALLAKIDAYLT